MSSATFGGLLRLHGNDLARVQRVLDPVLAAGLFVLLDHRREIDPLVLPTWLWIMAFTALMLSSGGVYASYRQASLFTLARRVSSRWLLVLTALLLLTYLTKTTASFSRIETSLWALSCWLLLLLNHVGLRQLLRCHRQRGGNSRTILYWGMPAAAAAFQAELRAAPWMGLRMVAWFSPIPVSPDQQPPQFPSCGGGVAEMRRWLESHSVDRIVFSHVTRDGFTMGQLLALFGDTCLPVVYAPDWAQSNMHFRVDRLGHLPCIDLWGSEASLIDRHLKRSFDLALTSTGVVLISPLLLAIAIAVALSSPGPILFVQDRYGLDGKRFRIYKFRTMRVMEAGDPPVSGKMSPLSSVHPGA
ncbi:sugar transferase [Synechococcus sp. CBW1002]|uniref:sugar transferase n=1 Tax=Synechococcus sp. CBW1002 TaxID=1353134 RepID=UPI0018CE05A9|nr:sugar transferase [Synechococcus sp. CBW1002]QPN59152.1 sugar transferase [Synechococcus sp. CBW1002]